MDETEMENEYDSDSSKDSEHQQLLSERAEEAEMKFDDAKLRIVNLMAQKTLSIRELDVFETNNNNNYSCEEIFLSWNCQTSEKFFQRKNFSLSR